MKPRRLTYDMISLAVLALSGAMFMGAFILWATTPGW
jgi:hypothetical protein